MGLDQRRSQFIELFEAVRKLKEEWENQMSLTGHELFDRGYDAGCSHCSKQLSKVIEEFD